MTDYKNHLLGGFVITIVASLFIFISGLLIFNLYNVCILLLISSFFSLLPDIDIGTSIIRKVVSCMIGLAMIYFFIINHSYWVIGLALALMIPIYIFAGCHSDMVNIFKRRNQNVL